MLEQELNIRSLNHYFKKLVWSENVRNYHGRAVQHTFVLPFREHNAFKGLILKRNVTIVSEREPVFHPSLLRALHPHPHTKRISFKPTTALLECYHE